MTLISDLVRDDEFGLILRYKDPVDGAVVLVPLSDEVLADVGYDTLVSEYRPVAEEKIAELRADGERSR